MGKSSAEIDDKLAAWIKEQKMFFVGTAPLSAEGLVNLSPKGLDSFRVLNKTEVAYLDLTGSGVETIAHIKENQRITIMFCAFSGAPKILRIYGKGTVIEKSHPDFENLFKLFPPYEGARAIIKIKATRVAGSCGYAVPTYEFKDDRDTLELWAKKQGADGLTDYRKLNNTNSLDGLPGIG